MSCNASNESHAIFCAACGVMKFKPALREAGPSVADEPPLPPPLQFQGTVAGFWMGWVGATAGGMILGWLLQSALSTGLFQILYDSLGEVGSQVASAVLSALIYGTLVGFFQGLTLGRRVDDTPWIDWAVSTLAGAFVSNLAYLGMPAQWSNSQSYQESLLWGSLSGTVGGLSAGLLQARVLTRRFGSARWTLRWTAVSVAASLLGNLAGITLWHSLIFEPRDGMAQYYLAGVVHVLVDGVVTASLAGPLLGVWLRRTLAGRP